MADAEGFTRAVCNLACRGLSEEAKAAFHCEITVHAIEQIWDDQKAGLPAEHVAARAFFNACNIGLAAITLRQQYREDAATLETARRRLARLLARAIVPIIYSADGEEWEYVARRFAQATALAAAGIAAVGIVAAVVTYSDRNPGLVGIAASLVGIVLIGTLVATIALGPLAAVRRHRISRRLKRRPSEYGERR